jgi:hypothetical protein
MLGKSNTRDGCCPDELKLMACTIALSPSLGMIASVGAQCLIGDRQTLLCISAIARGLTTCFTVVTTETFVNASTVSGSAWCPWSTQPMPRSSASARLRALQWVVWEEADSRSRPVWIYYLCPVKNAILVHFLISVSNV